VFLFTFSAIAKSQLNSVLQSVKPHRAADVALVRLNKARHATWQHDLSDSQSELILNLMPHSGPWGGGRWCDLPEFYGPCHTDYQRLTRLRREGCWTRFLDQPLLRPNAEGLVELDLWCIDSASVRASHFAAVT
jgi:hypothetical protein